MYHEGHMKIDDELREILLKNRYVERVTEKQIIYKSDFKVAAVEQYQRGIAPSEILEGAGIPLRYFRSQYARDLLRDWLDKTRSQGIDSLKTSMRGKSASASRGRPRKHFSKMTYTDLEALVEVQARIIEDLKKKRALAKKK